MKENNIKKSMLIIGIGIINLLHAGLHIIQFLQSIILVRESLHKHDESGIESILHNPIVAFIWAIVGFITLWMGIKDFKHHKKCNHKHDESI